MLWQVDTLVDRTRAYSVTGAPQIAGKNVVIGNGGAEFDSRGYVTAYDLETGKQAWRFYTVPRDPKLGPEGAASDGIMAKALETWHGTDWDRGGGGNAWDAFNYDPETNLVYFGTANGAPWSRTLRSPGGGDNLFLASIVALNADTGAYAWHYQTTPGERWDYDAHAAPDAGHAEVERGRPQGADAGLEERLLLRARPQDRRVPRGRQVRRCELGRKHRREDRPAGGEQGRGLQRRQAEAGVPVGRGWPQLQSDVAEREDGPGVHPDRAFGFS